MNGSNSRAPSGADKEEVSHNPNFSRRSRLDEKLAHWRKKKYRTAAWFLLLGVVGIFLPVIPGLLFLGMALWLLFPKLAEKLWGGLKRKFTSD